MTNGISLAGLVTKIEQAEAAQADIDNKLLDYITDEEKKVNAVEAEIEKLADFLKTKVDPFLLAKRGRIGQLQQFQAKEVALLRAAKGNVQGCDEVLGEITRVETALGSSPAMKTAVGAAALASTKAMIQNIVSTHMASVRTLHTELQDVLRNAQTKEAVCAELTGAAGRITNALDAVRAELTKLSTQTAELEKLAEAEKDYADKIAKIERADIEAAIKEIDKQLIAIAARAAP